MPVLQGAKTGPELPGAVVLRVRTARQVLIQALHEPTDIVQSLAPSLDDQFSSLTLGFRRTRVRRIHSCETTSMSSQDAD
jgi:hypothetical protein